ncbi:hypothetical protein ASPCADRAFT_208310 [Aspergillus carbonarius ITEM 5010]|uniref:C2 domain-containing protein n=1 Tax=Aspergillus carbonarius (strain ITEM 5010) TaxID=602072 RepID=A0A1R3RJJ5_ASPC5|nr:hypothetical protein ASPCADRAFT_208310 [Aspergillus carbonarius ITEM 5010]
MDARAHKRVSMAHAAHAAGIFADMSVDGPAIGTLVVIVDRAKNLPNRKTMGKQNPYCAARLGKEAKKTDTDVRGGQTPRWDQELRFTVHGSPDYYKLKVSVFNDEKKTDLIGETWIDLKDLIIPGGSQNDHWHPLQFRGKYAGEVRLEMTYYDTRPEDEAVIERRTHAVDRTHIKKPSSSSVSTSSSSLSGPRQLKDVKRRPLPSDPRSGSTISGSESVSYFTDHCELAGSSSVVTESSGSWPAARHVEYTKTPRVENSSDSGSWPACRHVEHAESQRSDSSDSARYTTYRSSPDINKLLDKDGFVKDWRHWGVKYNSLPSTSEESFSPLRPEYSHTREQATHGYSPSPFSDVSSSTYALLQPRVEDEEEDGPPPPPPVHRSIPDYQIVPRRKSVSPQPPSMTGRDASPIPFSPDSYGTEAAREPGPIIGDDGREIDPSDHLPTNTWAPEPERKTKKPGVVVRFRNPLYRGSPTTDHGHRDSMSETYSTSSSSSLYAQHSNPLIPSTVPVGLPNGNYAKMDGNIDALSRELNTIEIGSGRKVKYALLR